MQQKSVYRKEGTVATYGPAFAGSDAPSVEPKQIYFEDVKEGQEIPSKTKGPLSVTDLVVFAGASGDFAVIHHDREKAIASGLPDIILHGQCKIGFMVHMVSEWIGLHGKIKKIGGQYRGMDIINDTVVSQGTVQRKYTEGGENLVELEVWNENSRAGKTVVGHATVSLPSRSS